MRNCSFVEYCFRIGNHDILKLCTISFFALNIQLKTRLKHVQLVSIYEFNILSIGIHASTLIILFTDLLCENCAEHVNCDQLTGCSQCLGFTPPECREGDRSYLQDLEVIVVIVLMCCTK